MKTATHIDLPYFDILLEKLDRGIPELDRAFGRHVHWGYWKNPQVATGTVEDFAAAAERLSKEVYTIAGAKAGQRILDAGCGFGGTIASLNETFDSVNLTGLNIDPRQLSRAREKVRPRSGNKIDFIEGNACAMPFPNESFDMVLAIECIFHFSSRSEFFAEARRVLKPGGTLAITDFVPTRMMRLYSGSRLAKRSRASIFGPVRMDCTLKDYRRLASEFVLKSRVEEDITAGTIPTYPFLRKLRPSFGTTDMLADWRSFLAEWASRLGWIGYWILVWEKSH
jgi:SAM-dependent methyltransferase